MLRCLAAALEVGVLFAIGCAATPQSREALRADSITPSSADGVVSLEIALNQLPWPHVDARRTRACVRSESSGRVIGIEERSPMHNEHRRYVGALAAGSYAFVGGGWADCDTIRPMDTSAAARFTIAEGRVTDLGTIAAIAEQRGFGALEARRLRWGHATSRFGSEILRRQLPRDVAELLLRQPPLGWDDEATAALDALFAVEREHTMRLRTIAVGNDGEWLFGESFGQVGVRSRDGQWRFVQTGHTASIRALHRSGDGRVFAGFDEGVVLVGGIDGRDWRLLPLPEADASVLHIGPLAGTEELFVAAQTSTTLIGWSTPRSNPGVWREQFREARTLGQNPLEDSTGYAFSSAARTVFVTGSVNHGTTLLDYDSKRGVWNRVAIDRIDVPGWVMFADGTLVGVVGTNFTGGNLTVSKDGARSWDKRGKIPGGVVMVDDRFGYALELTSRPALPNGTWAQSLWTTADGGRTWTRVGPLPTLSGPGSLVAVDANGPIAFTGHGKFYVSADRGQHWTLERKIP